MNKGCKVCAAWHEDHVAGEDCGHWCHFAGAEDWDTRGQDGQAGDE